MALRELTFGSLCSGIGCFDLALERVGWRVLWQCECDQECQRVLRRHWPDVPLYGDLRSINGTAVAIPTLIVGGTPCQDWSVAGKRAGLAGERTGLFFDFIRVADQIAPRWILWENVPGLLSACSCPVCRKRRAEGKGTLPEHRGEDFATVLECFTGFRPELPAGGWRNAGVCWGHKRSCAWRVLDAQYVGGCPLHVQERGRGPVPQSRRRVFVVARHGDAGGLACQASERDAGRLRSLPAQVLFEPESSDRHFATGGKKRKKPAGASPGGAGESCGFSESGQGWWKDGIGALRAEGENRPSRPSSVVLSEVAHALRAEGADASEDGTGRGTPLVAFNWQAGGNKDFVGCKEDRTDALGASQTPAVAYTVNAAESCAKKDHAREVETARSLDSTGGFAGNQGGTVIAFQERGRDGGRSLETQEDVAYALTAPNGGGRRQERNVASGTVVRRLTPLECLRLQGLPDDWLDVEPPLSDSAKYRMIGNSGARPVLEWLGNRIWLTEEKEGVTP